ncbi:MAG TPA: PfkB family carbohydrate kinase, partial [Acidimicrobiales bacterium]|nr:PfkB family carbohydrate kinase [Acidimicrobiales bacterium]
GGDGNAAAWPGGSTVVPFGDQDVVDTTGGGDALMAGLISGLLSGADPLTAVCTGVAAAGPVVATVGGRPDFDPEEVRLGADRLRRRVERNPPSR